MYAGAPPERHEILESNFSSYLLRILSEILGEVPLKIFEEFENFLKECLEKFLKIFCDKFLEQSLKNSFDNAGRVLMNSWESYFKDFLK